MRVVSLFSGIGGFEVGIKNSKVKAEFVFSSEIDKYAQASYLSNFKMERLYGDITKIDEKKIPDHDFLVAGFPCQSFSIAGKRLGFEDTRGTLFFDIARILKEKKPKFILLENVKNLVSHDSGNTIKTILKTLNEIGYIVDFTIINSLEAGLPQNRERTYIIGVFDGQTDKKYYDIRNQKIDDLKKNFEYKGFDFFNTLKFNNSQKYIVDILEETKDKRYLITNEMVENYLKNNAIEERPSCENKIIKLFDLPKEVWNDLERQRRVYSVYGISPTILARSDTTKIYIKNQKESYVRKLTPRESFRLQGFEDDFIDNIANSVSITQQYKQAGNAVSPPVVEGICNHLFDFFYKEIKEIEQSANIAKKITFIDLFSGLGGFRIAFEKLGAKCVFSSDIDVHVQKIYEKNFGEKPYGDITQINAKDIPDHDILCAGFPCQAFSIAGKRLGFEDTRGTLFFDVARILKEKNPKGFILENVKGITNHDNGKTLELILSTLNDLGYEYKFEVLNAKDYNVPQNRERWYCVGVNKESGISINDFKFPEKEELKIKLKDIIVENIDEVEYKCTESCVNNIQKYVDIKKINVTPYTLAYDIRPSRCLFVKGDISNCLTAKMGTGGNNVPVIVSQKRKLTEKECLALMGFPKTYQIGKGYQAYKQIGNSIVVPVISKIAQELIKILNY